MFHLRERTAPHAVSALRARQGCQRPVGPTEDRRVQPRTLVDSRADVDAVLAQAEAAGATLTERPHDRPWGIYSGYFRDLDGHLWEIIWNPRLARLPT